MKNSQVHKFRAYHPVSGMAFFDLQSIFNDVCDAFTGKPTFGHVLFDDGDLRLVDDIEVMQFIDRLDANGKEIFTGDIVRIDLRKGLTITAEISFSNGSFWFTGDGHTDCNWHHYDDIRVIGNIYQNPELLEK